MPIQSTLDKDIQMRVICCTPDKYKISDMANHDALININTNQSCITFTW